jgi:hypothetical protein
MTPLFISRKTQDPVQQPTYGTDMRTIERWAAQLKSGGSGVTKLQIGTTDGHGKQITITPATGTGDVTIAIPATLDITILKASQIEPSGGHTTITIEGNTIVIKGSTELYLAGIIKLLRTPTGVTGQMATAASPGNTVSETTFKAALAWDSYRTMTVTFATFSPSVVSRAFLGVDTKPAASAQWGKTEHPGAGTVGMIWVPGGLTVTVSLTNCTFQEGYLWELG